jgi:fibronectin type 3 domain-containing protein
MKKILLAMFLVLLVSTAALLAWKLIAVAAGPGHHVTLTWQAPAQGSAALRYNVYRSADSGRSFSQIATRITDTSFVDASVDSGRSYRYFVTSVDQAGNESVQSEPSNIKIP